jgi:hypothetical protein
MGVFINKYAPGSLVKAKAIQLKPKIPATE